jgi:choline kinase
MKCLIIAAGLGSRISNMGQAKPLIPIHGIPLIEWVISTYIKVGIREFLVVLGHRAEEIASFLMDLQKRMKIDIRTIYNPDWKLPNGHSVLKAKDFLNETFFLTMADHLYEDWVLEQMKKQQVGSGVMLAVDYNINDNPNVDVDDVTKVVSIGSDITNISKELKSYNAFDTGIFLCTPDIFIALEKSIAKGNASLSGGIQVLANEHKAKAFDIGEESWFDVDDPKVFKKADIWLSNTLLKNVVGKKGKK